MEKERGYSLQNRPNGELAQAKNWWHEPLEAGATFDVSAIAGLSQKRLFDKIHDSFGLPRRDYPFVNRTTNGNAVYGPIRTVVEQGSGITMVI